MTDEKLKEANELKEIIRALSYELYTIKNDDSPSKTALIHFLQKCWLGDKDFLGKSFWEYVKDHTETRIKEELDALQKKWEEL